jgi:hypothetical protein
MLLLEALIRPWSDAAQDKTLDRTGVGCAKKRTGVVETAHVVEKHHDGQAPDVRVSLSVW